MNITHDAHAEMLGLNPSSLPVGALRSLNALGHEFPVSGDALAVGERARAFTISNPFVPVEVRSRLPVKRVVSVPELSRSTEIVLYAAREVV